VDLADVTCRIRSRDRAATLAALVLAAGQHGLTIKALNLRGSTLEDVFIHFTGRELRDATGGLRFDQRLLHEA
jgi:hypothetical protein